MLSCSICHEITVNLIVVNREDPQINWLSNYYKSLNKMPEINDTYDDNCLLIALLRVKQGVNTLWLKMWCTVIKLCVQRGKTIGQSAPEFSFNNNCYTT